MIKNYLERSINEIRAAEMLKLVSENTETKKLVNIDVSTTFYSSVISHSYYSIFYAAKALLLTKNIKTTSPDIHKKTFESFKKEFVDTGILDVSLLEIYKKAVISADTLLEIFKDEKWKRGNFTYNTIPQANKEPAETSLKNAQYFVANITKVVNLDDEKKKENTESFSGLTKPLRDASKKIKESDVSDLVHKSREAKK